MPLEATIVVVLVVSKLVSRPSEASEATVIEADKPSELELVATPNENRDVDGGTGEEMAFLTA